MSKKRFVLSISLISLFSLGVVQSSLGSSLDCNINKISDSFKKLVFPTQLMKIPPKVKLPEVKIISSKKVKLGDIEFCEVVFSFSGENFPPEMSNFKQVAYIRNNLYIGGDVRVLENDAVKLVSQDRMTELNRDLLKTMPSSGSTQKNNIDPELRNFNNVKSYFDVKLINTKQPEVEFVVFVDPLCPHCSKVIGYFSDKIKENNNANFNVNYVFTPVLGEQSKKIVASVLCDVKDEKMRLLKLKENYVSNQEICKEGLQKAEKNVELFVKSKARGVPLILVYKKENGNMSFNEIISGANIPAIDAILSKSKVKKDTLPSSNKTDEKIK